MVKDRSWGGKTSLRTRGWGGEEGKQRTRTRLPHLSLLTRSLEHGQARPKGAILR